MKRRTQQCSDSRKNRNLVNAACSTALAIIGSMGANALAITKQFSNTAGTWTTASNWTPSGVPTSTDDVLIAGGTTTMTLTASDLEIQFLTSTNTSSRILENSTGGSTPSNLTLNALDANGYLININPASGSPVFTIRNGTTAALNLIFAANGNLNVAGTSQLTISSTISETGGPRALNKSGTGTVQLSASNTFTGAVAINAGTLTITALAAAGTAQPLGQATTAITLGTASTAGALTYTGATTGVLDRQLSLGAMGGTFAVSSGTGSVNFTGGAVGTGPLTINNTGTVAVNTNGIGGSVTTLTKAGAGTLTLNAASTYSGNTTINAGTIVIGVNNALPSGQGVIFNNPGSTSAALIVNNNFTQAVASIAFSATAVGSGSAPYTQINLNGSGAELELNGPVTYTGTGLAFPLKFTGSGVLDLGNAVRDFSITSNGNGSIGGDVQLETRMTGTGGGIRFLTGTGTLGFYNTTPDYTGGLVMSATSGTLRFEASSSGPAGAVTNGPVGTGVLTINAGTVLSNNASGQTINNDVTIGGNFATQSINFGGAIGLGTANRQITVGGSAAGTLSGVIGGGAGGAIEKLGTGALVISNPSNSYTGATTLAAGTLGLGGDNVLGGGNLNLSGGTIASSSTALRTANNNVVMGGNVGVASINFTGSSFDVNGAGRTITLVGNANSTITAPITATGSAGVLVTVSGTSGALTIAGANTNNSGSMTIARGTVIAGSGSLPSGRLQIGNGDSNTTSPAVLLTNGTINRLLGTGSGSIAFGGPTNSVQGLAATGSDLTVNFGGAGAQVTWATGSFVNGTLALGSTLATHKTELQNAVSLGTSGTNIRRVMVDDNTSTTNDRAIISGKISGTSGNTFSKEGNGVLVLSNAANDYVGPTVVSSGTLVVSGALTGSGAVTNGAGAQLATGPTGSITGPVSISSTGSLAPGEVGSVGSMSLGGNLTFVSGATANLFFDINSPTNLDQILMTGGSTLAVTGNAAVNIAGTVNTSDTYILFSGFTTRTGNNFTLGTIPNGFAGLLSYGTGTVGISFSIAPRNLTWDSNGGTTPASLDGSGTWDNANLNWYDGTTNVAFESSRPDNAVIGNGGTGGAITLGSNITVGNLTFNAVASTPYTIQATTNETLTANGSITANESATIDADVVLAANGSWNVTNAAKTLAVNGDVGQTGGARSLTKEGTGRLVLTGANIFAGGLTVNNGTLSVQSDAALGATAGGVTAAFGALQFDNASGITVNSARTVTLAGGSIEVTSGTTADIAGVVAGSSVLNKIGAGTLQLSNTGNTFTGSTGIWTGAVKLGANEVLPNGANVNMQAGGAILDVNGKTETVASVGSSGGFGEVKLGGGSLNVTSTATYTGIITGTGGNFSIVPTLPTGATTYTLQGDNTFTGAFNIGTLYANGADGGTIRGRAILSTTGKLSGVTAVNIFNSSDFNITQAVATNIAGRLNASGNTITSNSGRFSYTSSTATITDNLPALTSNGMTLITQTSLATYGATTLNFGDFSQGDDKGTLWFRAGGAGSFGATASSRTTVYFDGGLETRAASGTPTGTSIALVPYASMINTVSGTDTATAITYDATNGVQSLAWTGSNFKQVGGGSLGANENNNLTADLAVSTNVVVNSLTSSAGGTRNLTGTATITNFSGYLATFGTLNVNGPTIQFSDTGYIHLGFPVNIQGTSRLLGSEGIAVSASGTGASYMLNFTSSAASTFTGGLFINGNASVQFTNPNQVGGSTSGFVLGGGSLNYNGTTPASFASTQSLKINAANGTIQVSNSTGSLTFNGTMSGTGKLFKTGVGTLTLNPSSSTYTGPIDVNAGRLNINGDLGTSSNPINVASAATLGGTGNTGRPVNINGGTLSPGTSPGVLATGNLTLNSASNLMIENTAPVTPSFSFVNVTGSVSVNGTLRIIWSPVPGGVFAIPIIQNDGSDPVSGTFASILLNGAALPAGWAVHYNSPSFGSGANDVFLSVPEPSSGVVVGFALAGLVARRRRSR